MVSKRNLLFQGAIFRFHVKLGEGISDHLGCPPFPVRNRQYVEGKQGVWLQNDDDRDDAQVVIS